MPPVVSVERVTVIRFFRLYFIESLINNYLMIYSREEDSVLLDEQKVFLVLLVKDVIIEVSSFLSEEEKTF